MSGNWQKFGIGALVGVVFTIVAMVYLSQGPVLHTRQETSPKTKEGGGSSVALLLRERYEGCQPRPVLCGNDHSWDGLSLQTAQVNFDRMMNSPSYHCIKSRRFGKKGDGGYELCLDPPFEFNKTSCIVYSFGINNEWSFDDDVHTHLGCEVHSFDPSMGKPDHVRKPNMYFHNLGLWGDDFVNDKDWKLERFSTIKKRIGHENRVIDAVKIDVESAEWPALRDMILSGDLDFVKQMILEIHTPKLLKLHDAMTLQDYAEIHNYYASLDILGFKLFLMHNRNGCCGKFHNLVSSSLRIGKGPTLCCYETYFVNSKYITT